MQLQTESNQSAVLRVPFVSCRIAITTCVILGCLAAVPYRSTAQQSGHEPRSRNAADYYREAAALVEQISPSGRALIGSTAELEVLSLYSPTSPWSEVKLVSFVGAFPTDETAASVFEGLEPALELFRQGAESPECDWGFDFSTGNLSTPLPQLPIVPELVRAVLFHARYNWAVGNRDEAIRDLEALKRFASHVGANGDGGLISLVVQFNIERVVVHTISSWLVDADSARNLAEVAQEPDRPPMNLAQKGLLLETETVLPRARSLIDTSELTEEQRRNRYRMDLITNVYTIGQLVRRYSEAALLEQIEDSKVHYHDVGQILELPVDEFRTQYDAYIHELTNTNNFFSEIGLIQCPGIERVYYDVKEMRVRWRMLRAAIDILQSGRDAVAKHADPFGDSPFTYLPRNDGFELRSELVVNGSPVTIRFNASPG